MPIPVVELPVENDPTIAFRIWFKVGSQHDPPGKEGLAHLTAAMIAQGSTHDNAFAEVLDKLHPLAATYGAMVSTEMTVFSGRVHRDNFEPFYALFMGALLRPAFVQHDLDRLKSEQWTFLANVLRYSSDEELSQALLYNDVFVGTPYGHIPEGCIDTVPGLSLDDVRAFYRAHWTCDNVVIGIGGSYDGEVLQRLQRDLQEMPQGKAPSVGLSQPRRSSAMTVTIVQKAAPATAMRMGFPIAVHRGTREWYALALANSWFGEHRHTSSHLFQVIREARGLNYGDYSYIEFFPGGDHRQMPPPNVPRRQHLFEMWIRPVAHDAAHFAIRAALYELSRLIRDGLDSEQFEQTRTFLRKYIKHYAPTTMDRLGYALDDRFYGLDQSHLARFRTMMEELTLEEVNTAIQRHLAHRSVHCVVITEHGDHLREALVHDVPSPISYSTPKPTGVLAEDAKIAVFPLHIAPHNVHMLDLSGVLLRR